MTEVYII